MNATRAVIWMLGLVAILAGAYLLYFEAGLDRWISIGLLGAGLLLFVGLAIMTFANNAPRDPSPRVVHDRDEVVVERAPRTVVERDDRRYR
ncbi:MAG TPA: hypothetical protein VM327_00300 [Candidatus Thermoplasmatota archaeon]|nr:hypothetical protein [Candidatus Thermoplasmatota archaeon]